MFLGNFQDSGISWFFFLPWPDDSVSSKFYGRILENCNERKLIKCKWTVETSVFSVQWRGSCYRVDFIGLAMLIFSGNFTPIVKGFSEGIVCRALRTRKSLSMANKPRSHEPRRRSIFSLKANIDSRVQKYFNAAYEKGMFFFLHQRANEAFPRVSSSGAHGEFTSKF